MKLLCALALSLIAFLGAIRPASAQVPDRDDTWETVTTITTISAAASQLLMPRVFYSSPEVTVGWKARWHVSALAPIATLTTLTFFNEHVLKDAFEGARPGCNDENQGGPGCETFGMLSSHSFSAFSSLGMGAAVFIFDTTKYSGGRFHGGAFAGQVGLPLVLAGVTAIGRGAGDWETTGQILAGGGAGLVSGFLMGTMYALMQEPECGYSGSLICW